MKIETMHEKKQRNYFIWLFSMAMQTSVGFFVPRGKGIAFILHFLYTVKYE